MLHCVRPVFFIFALSIYLTCPLVTQAAAIEAEDLEILLKQTSDRISFIQSKEVFTQVAKKNKTTLKAIVKELQELDPTFAAQIAKDQDYWKLSFLLDQGWDPSLPDDELNDLLVVVLKEGHEPNIDLVLKVAAEKLLKERDITKLIQQVGYTDYNPKDRESEYQAHRLADKLKAWKKNPKDPELLEGQPETYQNEGLPRSQRMAPSVEQESAPRSGSSGGNRDRAAARQAPPLYTKVEIPYATNRAMDSTKRTQLSTPEGAESFYSFTDAGNLSYGIAQVTIPNIHKAGQLEERGLFEFKWNPEKHVMLQRLRLKTSEEFYQDLGERFKQRKELFKDQPGSEDLFVYIHGFNTDFSYAMRKTAQLMYDMDYPGVSIAYSWPAKVVKLPLPQDFRDDVSRAEASKKNLEEFLTTLKAKYPEQRIHIVAHSLGTRVLSQVLLNMAKAGTKMFGEIILAAPAMDAKTFIQGSWGPGGEFIEPWAKTIAPLCDRISIMASDDDYALKVQSLAEDENFSFPLGLWTKNKRALGVGLFNFDISKLSSGTMSLDHSTYSEVSRAIDHIAFMIKSSPTATQLSEARYMVKRRKNNFFDSNLREVWDFLEH